MIKLIFWNENLKGINPKDKFVELSRHLYPSDYQGIISRLSNGDLRLVERSGGDIYYDKQ